MLGVEQWTGGASMELKISGAHGKFRGYARKTLYLIYLDILIMRNVLKKNQKYGDHNEYGTNNLSEYNHREVRQPSPRTLCTQY